jgi:hypothetical protein
VLDHFRLTNAFCRVYCHLLIQHVITLLIVCIPVWIRLFSLVNGSKLAFYFQLVTISENEVVARDVKWARRTVPDRHIMLFHEFYFSVVHLANICVLVGFSLISTNPIWETKATVIMHGIDRIREDLVEARKIHTETTIKMVSSTLISLRKQKSLRISFQEDDMLGVNCSYCRHNTIVER